MQDGQMTWLWIAALNGALAVALGAFAAHGLKAVLDPAALSTFDTATRYHMFHALALLGPALLSARTSSRLLHLSGAAFLLGILLFSGSLYILSLTGSRAFVLVTPVGGLSFIAGWLLLAAVGWQNRKS